MTFRGSLLQQLQFKLLKHIVVANALRLVNLHEISYKYLKLGLLVQFKEREFTQFSNLISISCPAEGRV